MRNLLIILLANFVLSCASPPEPDFFFGEWKSISDKNTKRAAPQLLFIDSSNQFSRTSFRGKDYLFDYHAQLKGATVYSNNKVLFELEVIDSNTIELSSDTYRRQFKRTNDYLHQSIEATVRGFVLRDSLKKELVGKWEMEASEFYFHGKTEPNYFNAYYFQENSLFGQECNGSTVISFDSIHTATFINKGSRNKMGFRVRRTSIEFAVSDLIIPLKFKMEEAILHLDERHRYGTRKMQFRRK